MNREFLKTRTSLILTGIALGWIARLVIGAPAEELGPARSINRPLNAEHEDEDIDMPIIRSESTPQEPDAQDESGGLVPPIRLPGTFAIFGSSSQQHLEHVRTGVLFDEQAHDEDAVFEAHGEQLCASGCALSRHPTGELTSTHFIDLVKQFADGPLDDTNSALEELIYFGPQTRRLIETEGVGDLAMERARFLWDQLTVTHAKISIRVKDETGAVRTWIDATSVPFDRRHVFAMKTNNVQPLVTSGTVKRVGLNHVWTRL